MFHAQALEEAEELRRQALARAAHEREMHLVEERERKEKLSRIDARNREEERIRKAEEHRLQVPIELATNRRYSKRGPCGKH